MTVAVFLGRGVQLQDDLLFCGVKAFQPCQLLPSILFDTVKLHYWKYCCMKAHSLFGQQGDQKSS